MIISLTHRYSKKFSRKFRADENVFFFLNDVFMIIKSSLWFHQRIFDRLICWFSTSNNNAWSSIDDNYCALRSLEHHQRETFDLKLHKEWSIEKKERFFWILDILWEFWREIDVILIKISSMQIKYVHKTKLYTFSIFRFVESATFLLDESFRKWYDHTHTHVCFM